jgi:Fe-S-cluster containining protein
LSHSLIEEKSKYCLEICKAKCCKRGKLPLTIEEAKFFDKKRIDNNNFYDLKDGCEHLEKDNKCKIYLNRPSMCREYPFHHFGAKIIANVFCQAVELGFYNEEIEEKKAKKF